MTRPLRILMVCHMPWSRNLGGARVQVELADEFRALGHHVEKFSYEDAFPRGRSRIGDILDPRAFARRAKAFVQNRRADFDVIDAHQGNLPYSKADLGFSGLLVVRSVGLVAFYEKFAREERVRWPTQYHGSRAGGVLRGWRARRLAPTFPRSLREADLINVCNRDELAYVRNVLGQGDKCVFLPFGMTCSRQYAFQAARVPAEERLARQTVAFVGFWAPRKGSFDWGDIVRNVWAYRPATRFLFLGTGRGEEFVRADLGIGPDDRVIVVPSYPTDDLPNLLSGATVGAFPSYIEGFPFGVLELFAAGLPTIAYDAPGSRELLREIDLECLVPPGDTARFASRLLNLLGSTPSVYRGLSEMCARTADDHTWPRIARDTWAWYEPALRNGHVALSCK